MQICGIREDAPRVNFSSTKLVCCSGFRAIVNQHDQQSGTWARLLALTVSYTFAAVMAVQCWGCWFLPGVAVAGFATIPNLPAKSTDCSWHWLGHSFLVAFRRGPRKAHAAFRVF
jgi:hypothetical protein